MEHDGEDDRTRRDGRPCCAAPWFVRKLFTLLGHFSKMLETKFKNTFNLCSHIELLTTQNPNTIFKITIYCTKQITNAKTHSKCWTIFEKIKKIPNFYFVICTNYIIHILYFWIFCKFCNFGIFVLLNTLYYTCRSLTRVGLLHETVRRDGQTRRLDGTRIR